MVSEAPQGLITDECLRRLTEIPSVSNRVAAVATRETINLASSMREPFSSKAVEEVTACE